MTIHALSVIDEAHFMVTVVRNTAIPDSTTKGPGGSCRYPDNKTPDNALTIPKTELNIEYRYRFELRVLAVAAGTITRKPTSRLPTIFMPIATTRDTSRRYTRFVLATLTPLDVASSSEIIDKIIFL